MSPKSKNSEINKTKKDTQDLHISGIAGLFFGFFMVVAVIGAAILDSRNRSHRASFWQIPFPVWPRPILDHPDH